MVNTFTGIPSIIVGIFVYLTVVKSMGNFSAVAGGIALAIIMIPIIARTSEDVYAACAGQYPRGGTCAWHTHLAVILGIVIPAARSGIITGGVLAVARVRARPRP